MVEGKSMPSTGHAPSWKSGAGNLPPAASTIESAPLCSKLSTGRTSAWWLSRGWTSPPLPDPSGSWAPVSSGTTTPNSTAATTASASPPPADRRGGAGSRLGGREHRWEERDSTREREQRFLKAQPPPLCTEATAKPRVLPLQNPRSASREPLLPLWGGEAEPGSIAQRNQRGILQLELHLRGLCVVMCIAAGWGRGACRLQTLWSDVCSLLLLFLDGRKINRYHQAAYSDGSFSWC